MEQTIFETHDRFAKKIFNGNTKILDFNRLNLNLSRDQAGNLIRLKESDSWVCVLTDPELIKQAKEHPSFGKSFWKIDRIPTKKDRTTIVRKAIVSSESTLNLTELKNKAKRLGVIESKIILQDGSYSKNAESSLVEEHERLKQELEN